MPCFFMPMHTHAENAMHSTPCRRASSSTCSINPFALFFFLMCAPTILRIVLCVLAPFFNLALIAGAIYISRKFIDEVTTCCDDDAERTRTFSQSHSSSTHTACNNLRSCFAKMKVAARAEETKATSTKTSTSHTLLRRRDLSSVSVQELADVVRVIVSAPGLKPEALKVSVVDDTLHVHGETKTTDGELYVVDRTIVPSRRVDLDASSCSHVDGILTISIPRKATKSIPVTKGVDVAPVAEEAAPGVAADPDSEGEWIEPAAASKDVE